MITIGKSYISPVNYVYWFYSLIIDILQLPTSFHSAHIPDKFIELRTIQLNFETGKLGYSQLTQNMSWQLTDGLCYPMHFCGFID